MTQLLVNGNTYSDDKTAARDLTANGHRQWLLAMFADAMLEIGAQTGNVLGFGTRYLFDAATAAADPGVGLLRFNNAAAASTTAIYIDNQNSAATDMSGWLATINANKGQFWVRNAAASKWHVFTIATAAANSGYYTLTVTYGTGMGSAFTASEPLILSLAPAGPPGTVSAASDGTISAPGISFASESGLGIRRKSAGVAAVTAGAADLIELRAATLAEAQNGVNTLAVMPPDKVAAAILAQAKLVNRSDRTSNSALTTTDRGNLINVTTGGFTQTLVACATLTAGWFCFYRNSSTSVVTIDPNASETIDGRATINVYPGETLMLTTDGSALLCVGRDRWVNLGSTTVGAAVATVDMETGFSDTEIVNVRVVVIGMSGSSTGVPGARLKFAGAYSASAYIWNGFGPWNGGGGAQITTGASQIDLAPSGNTYTAAGITQGFMDIFNIQAGSAGQHSYAGQFISSDNVAAMSAVGRNTGGGAVQGIRFLYTTGNIDAGTFQVWGQRA